MENKLTGTFNLCKILKNHIGERFYYMIPGNDVIIQNTTDKVIIMCDADNNQEIHTVNGKGAMTESGECLLWPNRQIRSWDAFINNDLRESPKTWADLSLEKLVVASEISFEYNDSGILTPKTTYNTEEELAAAALIQFYQLINKCYGGVPSFKEKIELGNNLYEIYYNEFKKTYMVDESCLGTNFAVFYTKEAAEEFISYPENIKLLDTLFMRN